MKKTLVIARQTVGGYARDKVFHSVVVLDVMLVAFAVFLSTLTILEQRKILLDFGLAAISLVGVAFAIMLGVTIVRREMETRTVYAVLAKPVSRAEYLLGKFLGGSFVVFVVHAIGGLSLWLLLQLTGEGAPADFWPAIYLMVLEALLLLAAALLFSIYFSSLFLAVAIAFALFLLGRSNYSFLLLSQKAESAVVKELAGFFYRFFPSLQRFDIRELVAYGKAAPEGLVLNSSLYFAAYLVFLLGLSVIFFRRKDLP